MSRFTVAFVVGVFLGFSLAVSVYPFVFSNSVQLNSVEVTPSFSPGNQDAVVNLIRSSRSSLYVEMYLLSSVVLREELIAAKQRGVDVRVIIESSVNSNLESARELTAGGVSVKWASRSFALTHAKFIVVDETRVFMGSNNWSFHSFNLNREASVILQSREVAAQFLQVFSDDWENGVAA